MSSACSAGQITYSGKSNRFAQSGEQVSSVIGSGTDFADRRAYITGDDPRYIDWRASARSNQILIRNYYTEISVPACIVIDRRASMRFGTRKRLKVTQALRAGLTLGAQLIQNGFQLACLVLDKPGYWQAPQTGLAALRATAQIAARPCPPKDVDEDETSWGRISDCLRNRLPRASRIILISDFLSLDKIEQKALRQLAQNFDLSVIQIVDVTEQNANSLSSVFLHWGQNSLKIGRDSITQENLNQQLKQRLQQQAEWFGSTGCNFMQLAGHEELNRLDGYL